jgi:uncharacterized membrane protein
MENLYTAFIFLHILSAGIWFGGGVVIEVLALRLGPSASREAFKQFFDTAHWVSPRVFMPAALATIISGIVLVLIGGWSFSDVWIIFALVGVAITAFLGATQIGTTIAKMQALIESGADDMQLAAVGRRLHWITRLDLLILILVLLDMVVKPFN